MRGSALIELTVRSGAYGEDIKTVAVPISEDLTRELFGRVELSDEPFSVMLASPGMFGGYGDARTIRKQKFEMRIDIARKIADAMVPALMKAFGVNDELDGYRVADMGQDERAFYESRGRLPKQ